MADELDAMAGADEGIPADRLRLMFACAHPAIDAAVRAPLILQTVLGLDAATIASAFLIAPATMGQRLVRAKTKIKQAGIPFRIPAREELRERLATVLEAIYAAFAEGWNDPGGTELRRRDLATEAIWLGRLVVALLPDEAEALASWHLCSRRGRRQRAARRRRLRTARRAGPDDVGHAVASGRALAARPARSTRSGAINWKRRCESAPPSLHGPLGLAASPGSTALVVLTDSPVAALNRAVAIAECRGPGGSRGARRAREPTRAGLASAVLSGTTAFSTPTLGFVAIGCILVWSATQVITTMKLKMLYVEPETPRR
jgi:RNA polymerase sigma-70 factor (ECF subfamily)